jgi:hypothetical protein
MSDTLDKCTVPFGPVFDAKNDLMRLNGVVAAVAYLTNPDRRRSDEETADILHEVFCDITTRLCNACEQLEEAIKGMKSPKEARA